MHKRSLLLIDDNPDFLEMMADFLSDYYQVTCFSPYPEALSFMKKQREKLDIVISDFKMPDKNGIEVLTKAKELNPQTVRILFTGYADTDALNYGRHVFHRLICKADYASLREFVLLIEEACTSAYAAK